jgi:type II secretory pathway pseudopilin PulG
MPCNHRHHAGAIWPNRLLRPSAQSGSLLLEMLAALSLIGCLAASSLQLLERLKYAANETTAATTLAHANSALRLQRAQWLLGQSLPVVVSAAGHPLGLDADPVPTRADCVALWRSWFELSNTLQSLQVDRDNNRCLFRASRQGQPLWALGYTPETGELSALVQP